MGTYGQQQYAFPHKFLRIEAGNYGGQSSHSSPGYGSAPIWFRLLTGRLRRIESARILWHLQQFTSKSTVSRQLWWTNLHDMCSLGDTVRGVISQQPQVLSICLVGQQQTNINSSKNQKAQAIIWQLRFRDHPHHLFRASFFSRSCRK
uniref:Uncharacterized protein n=1 Tax=Daphnia galeata TaxID=27404 RepID=A0A8J2WBK8_9CRUS|nr:unnamed protein product [Daphnia galeata]